VRDNPGESRYELVLDEEVVVEIAYHLTPDRMVLVHTEVLPFTRKQGSRRAVGHGRAPRHSRRRVACRPEESSSAARYDR
jgi:hypothetical protein